MRFLKAIGVVLLCVVITLQSMFLYYMYRKNSEIESAILVDKIQSQEMDPTSLEEIRRAGRETAETSATAAQAGMRMVDGWHGVQEKVKDAVVQVVAQVCEVDMLQPYKTPNIQMSGGSGFFINEEGYLITNFHVVNQAKAVWIHIPSLGQRIIDVEVVGVCPEPDRDLALLRVLPHELAMIRKELGKVNFLPLGNSDKIRRADEVMALGYPLGQKSLKSTTGIMSGRERHYIQISAPINPGSSGGPLVNQQGEVMGVNSAGVVAAQNVGYAIPSNLVSTVAKNLQATPLLRKPFLGVWFQNTTPELTMSLGNPLPGGCFVDYIIKQSPLDRAGVKRGDMIYALNGYKIDQYAEMTVPWSEDKISMMDYVARLALGENIVLTTYRDGKKRSVKVVLGNRELPPIRFLYPGYEQVDYQVGLGMVVMPLTMNHIQLFGDQIFGLRKYIDMKNQSDPALLITHIFPNSQLYRTRTILPGSVIKEINGKEIKTLEEFRAVIAKAKPEEYLKIVTTDDVIVVLSLAKILEEENKLSHTFKYPLADNIKLLMNKNAPVKDLPKDFFAGSGIEQRVIA